MVLRTVEETRDVPRALEAWDVKCARVADEYDGKGLTEGMKAAVLIMMLSKDLQEMVHAIAKVGGDLKYQEITNNVVAVIGHKAKVKVPLPREECGTHGVENSSWGGMGR